MLSTSIKLLCRDVFVLFQRAEEMLIALGVERRCARRLDHMADGLLSMGTKISLLRDGLHPQLAGAAIDGDLSLRASLTGIKHDIRAIRCQVAALDGAGLPSRLQRAFRRLSAIAEETYAAADKLQWDIDERDRRPHG